MIVADLEQVCLEQQETIAKQSAVISSLLSEIAQYRALSAEEERYKKGETNGY